MRALIPASPDPVDVHQHYAVAWLHEGGIRANFVASVDGSGSADGRSRGLQTPGDNRVFAALRDLADVVLVGAGTARTEGYGAATPTAARQEIRRAHGLSPQLPTAVVTRSAHLDPDSALFHAGETPRTLVITCAAAAVSAALRAVADVLVCGQERVDLAVAGDALAARGLTRILCEGGPTLFADLVESDQLDELCLSVTPMLVGPGAARIVDGGPWVGGPVRLDLIGLLEEDGALFARYRLSNRAS